VELLLAFPLAVHQTLLQLPALQVPTPVPQCAVAGLMSVRVSDVDSSLSTKSGRFMDLTGDGQNIFVLISMWSRF
jgi:hypothetical protein